MTGRHDLIIVGGGLAGSVLALALARERPELDFLLIEADATFGGDHVWSFFDDDVPASGRELIGSAILRRWERHEVRFPRFWRQIPHAYNSMTSTLLDREVRRALPAGRYLLGAPAAEVTPTAVLLNDGRRFQAEGVIDARGAAALPGVELAWQVFVGCEYGFDRPHGLPYPIVMDATVEQDPGYRFVYCLPFTPHRLLVEDTYYTQGTRLDESALRARIERYADAQGWRARRLLRVERGRLPVALHGNIARAWDGAALPRIGLRGGFFHPTTGYSLPDALRIAELIATQRALDSASLHRLLARESLRLWRERAFFRLLNRLLFRAAAPAKRVDVFEHFYRLDQSLIARFYAARMRPMDRLRVLCGRPPVPPLAALQVALGLRRRAAGHEPRRVPA